jgi:hypothetical protein
MRRCTTYMKFVDSDARGSVQQATLGGHGPVPLRFILISGELATSLAPALLADAPGGRHR